MRSTFQPYFTQNQSLTTFQSTLEMNRHQLCHMSIHRSFQIDLNVSDYLCNPQTCQFLAMFPRH